MNIKTIQKKNKGFTLVELIVVLVILAILAAILIPALLGYIDRAREKKDILQARNCLEAAQVGFVEAYGKNLDISGKKNVLGLDESVYNIGDYGDTNAVDSDVAKAVKQCAEEEPYIFLVATGSCIESPTNKNTKRQMYTVYYACYVKEKDSVPYYYYNGTWSKANPTNIDIIKKDTTKKTNKLITDNGEIYVQYYILSNKDNLSLMGLQDNTFWGYLRNVLDKKYNK